MQHPRHDTPYSSTRSSCQDENPYYRLYGHDGYSDPVLYQVIPAGRNFFHILEVTSGRVKGFRSHHDKACELAKKLEAILQPPYGMVVSSPE